MRTGNVYCCGVSPIFVFVNSRTTTNVSAIDSVISVDGVSISFSGGGTAENNAWKNAMAGILIPNGATYSVSSTTSGAGIAG